MHYVWFMTVATDVGRVGQKNADVMQHRRLTYGLRLQIEPPGRGNIERELRHRLAMAHIYYPPGSARRVIFVNDLLICHVMDCYSTMVHHPCLSSISPRRIALRVS